MPSMFRGPPFRGPGSAPQGRSRSASGVNAGAGASSSPLASAASNPTTPVGGGQAPALFDDTAIDEGRNGHPASGNHFSRLLQLLNQCAYSGKPVYSFIGGTSVAGSVGYDAFQAPYPKIRQIYNGRNYGAVIEGAWLQYEQNPAAAGLTRWYATINDTSYTSNFNYSTPTVLPYPQSLLHDSITGTRGFTGANSEMLLYLDDGLGGFVNITPRSGVVWQEPQEIIDQALVGSYADSSGTVAGKNAYVGTQLVRAGSPIVGIRSDAPDAADVLQKARVSLLNAYQYGRGQIGWSCQGPDFGTPVTFSTSKNQFRYIFEQTYGTGGTGFGPKTPGLTLPLKYAGAGIYTQVRVYVFVYAAMSGTADTGSLGIANRDSSGGVNSTASAVTNPVTISGTTFQWYPGKVSPSAASLDLATAPYFLGYCGPNADYDRVMLCAKSSGTTDSVKIAAFTLMPIGAPF